MQHLYTSFPPLPLGPSVSCISFSQMHHKHAKEERKKRSRRMSRETCNAQMDKKEKEDSADDFESLRFLFTLFHPPFIIIVESIFSSSFFPSFSSSPLLVSLLKQFLSSPLHSRLPLHLDDSINIVTQPKIVGSRMEQRKEGRREDGTKMTKRGSSPSSDRVIPSILRSFLLL